MLPRLDNPRRYLHRQGAIRRDAGFTLLELAIVILVMLVLAGLLLRAARIAGDRTKIARCKSELSALRVAIDQYYKDNRRYPAGGTANQSDSLVRALVGTNSPRTYIDWPVSRLVPQGFLDPWGRAFGYGCTSPNPDVVRLGPASPVHVEQPWTRFDPRQRRRHLVERTADQLICEKYEAVHATR